MRTPKPAPVLPDTYEKFLSAFPTSTETTKRYWYELIGYAEKERQRLRVKALRQHNQRKMASQSAETPSAVPPESQPSTE